MICEKWVGNQKKKVFLVFILVLLTLVGVQYLFNYRSTALCGNNDKYVKRVVERVYYENPSFSQSSINQHQTTEAKENNYHTCSAEKYILFLKTHKTGSSTITNILNRYADVNNLAILTPKSSEYYSFDWPNKFRLESAANTYTRANILANHARYSRKSMNVLFPRESTFYISILRHPVSQFESTFQYMSFPYILGIANVDDPLDFFLDNPPPLSNIQEIARRYPSLYLIRNPLFFDLGLDHRYYENVTFIRRALKTLDNDFDLILIMEYFDESLTLLRRRLCWEIDDIVHFKLNERLNKNKRRILTERQIQKIKTWNNADMALYNYFLEKFWQEINNEGPGFYDDVAELRKRREHYKKVCIEREAIEEAYSSVYVKGYQMKTNLTGDTKLFCSRLLKNELKYMDYFRKRKMKWIKTLEGVTVENFETSREEVEIFLESPDIKYTDFKYDSHKRSSKKSKTRVTTKPSNNNLGPPTDDENNPILEKRLSESTVASSDSNNAQNLKTLKNNNIENEISASKTIFSIDEDVTGDKSSASKKIIRDDENTAESASESAQISAGLVDRKFDGKSILQQ